MKVLYLTHKPVFPMVDGGCKAMASFLELLTTDNEVQHIAISTNKHPFDLSAYPEDLHLQSVKNFFIDTDLSPFRAFKSLFQRGSYNANRFYHPDLELLICNTIKEKKIDIVVSESIFPLVYLNGIRKKTTARVYLRAHNIEHEIWKQQISVNSGFKRSFIKKLARDMEVFEKEVLEEVDGCIFISTEDQAQFRTFNTSTPSLFIPVTFKKHLQKVDYQKNDFFFLGAMNWEPNIQAVDELIYTIFPKIRNELPEAKLHLGGSFFPEHIKTNTEQGIIVHGFVENLFDFFNLGIQLVPLKSGSGVRIKLLETLSYGVPTVCSSIAAKGLSSSHPTPYSIADDMNSFAKEAILLANNQELRQNLGTQAKDYMEKAYNFDNAKKELIEFIR